MQVGTEYSQYSTHKTWLLNCCNKRILTVLATGLLVDGPRSLQIVSGEIATFNCISDVGTFDLLWEINGSTTFQQSASLFTNATIKSNQLSETFLIIDTSMGQFNETAVRCIVIPKSSSTVEYSNNATLLVQGSL